MSQDSKYIPGFYVNQNGDTVSGYFYTKDKSALSNLKIKRDLSEKTSHTISFDTCKVLSFGNDTYFNWYGKRGMAYISKFNFEIINIDSFVTEKIPLKLLYHGSYLSLYHYHDVTDHYFVGSTNSVEELSISYRYITDWEKMRYSINPPTYFINPIYRDQIITLMSDKLTRKQKYLVESCEFDAISLIRLFKKVNHSFKE